MNNKVEIIRLIRVDFDNLENSDPLTETTVGTFFPGPDISAYGKVKEWFKKQPPCHLYTGYDHMVYPKFRLLLEWAE